MTFRDHNESLGVGVEAKIAQIYGAFRTKRIRDIYAYVEANCGGTMLNFSASEAETFKALSPSLCQSFFEDDLTDLVKDLVSSIFRQTHSSPTYVYSTAAAR